MSDLLSIDDLGPAGIANLLELSDSFVEVTRREIPKVPALRGKTVVTLFYEDSTRTRLSFETAAKRLTADTMSFTAASSSVGKGESLLDTVRTIEAMGVDAMVVRHRCAGAPHRGPARPPHTATLPRDPRVPWAPDRHPRRRAPLACREQRRKGIRRRRC